MHLEEDLRSAGLSATKQRVALLSALRKLQQPASVEALARKLAGTMNTTTVYRALEQLIAGGLARRVHLGDNHASFEAVSSHHHHLVCRRCGCVVDVDACLPQGLSARILAKTPSFSMIEDHALEFFGLCKSCDTAR